MILSARAKLVSTAPVKIRINDDEELTKEVKNGQTLLAALTLQGIAVLSPYEGKAICKQYSVPLPTSSGTIVT